MSSLLVSLEVLERLHATLTFHPRAAKMMWKRKPFLVAAIDEPYFPEVYELIRNHAIEKGTWTEEDQVRFADLMTEHYLPSESSTEVPA